MNMRTAETKQEIHFLLGLFLLGSVEVQVVGGESLPVLGEVAVGTLAGRVTGYGLEQRHGRTYRKSRRDSATSHTGLASSLVLSCSRFNCRSIEVSSSRTLDASMVSRLG